MKKLIRFIKDNPLVKGKIYFYIFKFFFIMNLGILHYYENMIQGLYSSICADFVKKISNLNFQYRIIFLFYFFSNLCR